MDSSIKICHPSGAYGGFLAYLLNYMSIGQDCTIEESVYDSLDYSLYKEIKFSCTHVEPGMTYEIYINVDQSSYSKFFITNINRIAGANLVIEDLQYNTFEKIRNHRSLCFFETSLKKISNQTDGNVPNMFIREWFRLCFMADNFKTLQQYNKNYNNIPTNCYVVDFETFFSKSKIQQTAVDILNHFEIDIVIDNIDNKIIEFFNKQYYKNHIDINLLKQNIIEKNNVALDLNLVEQAWLDNWLIKQYNIDPRLKNEYFSNTKDLIDFYKLPI